MKILLISTAILLSSAYTLQAQDRVREKDLKGEWKMVFDFEEKDIEEEIKEDSWFGWMVASSVSELVVDIMEEIDIRMEFLERGELVITVHAFGEKEVEGAKWRINKQGELVITDEDDDKDDDDVWMLVDDKLVLFERSRNGRLEDKPIYMVRW